MFFRFFNFFFMMFFFAAVSPVLLAMENPFEKFGVTGIAPLIANSVAFIIAAIILKIFALNPIKKMLAERQQRILEAEEMRLKSQQTLNSVEEQSAKILEAANAKGSILIQEAKESASKYFAVQQQDAARQVEEILSKAHSASVQEADHARTMLRAEFSRLVAQATTQVTGKILTDGDKKLIDQETVNSL